MLKTILGLILLLVPFLLIYKFRDKKMGFAYILSFLIAFHLIVAIFLQGFGIFNYIVVVGINGLVALIILVKTNFKQFFENLKEMRLMKIDWILLFVIIVLFIQLYSVHYDYTGKVTTVVQPYKEVKNMKYPYPYFSDEWSAVALIQYSLASGKLPLVNPLWPNAFFPNLELPFHSFASEMILLLNLDPLINYSLLALFSGLLICLLIYFILRINQINKLTSAIASLSVPYIVNGANLPGIWNFLPLIMGIISLLLGVLFMSINNRKMILFMTFLTLVFYPPLFLFCTLSFVLYFIFDNISKKEKAKYIVFYFLIILISAVFVSIFTYLRMDYSFKNFVFSYIKSKLFYPTTTTGSIPDFSIWKVMPIPILLLSAFGILKTIKRKIWLVAPIFIGLIYWFFYSFRLERFIIEDARVVVVTSILIVLLLGFGLHYLIEYLKKFELISRYKILEIILIAILIAFFIFAFSYTQRDNWQELKLYSVNSDAVFNPAAPANNYLHPDDLKLFENIKEKRFLSIPWKGLVIGTATSNYPLDTKQATLTNHIADFKDFMEAECKRKINIAKKKKIDYVYSPKFDCEGFELRGVSGEGLHLYKVV